MAPDNKIGMEEIFPKWLLKDFFSPFDRLRTNGPNIEIIN